MNVAKEVAQFLHRYSTGNRLGVAVSGGADSTILLRLVAELAAFDVSVLHVNHLLRGPESEEDEEFARDLARQLRFPFFEHREKPGAGNLEAEARKIRYTFFRRFQEEQQLSHVLLAHTASDQAETVLFRLLRGSGIAGLRGIAKRTQTGVLRPMLTVTRDEVRNYGQSRGWTWREDSSNSDLRFRRNCLRLQTIPELARQYNSNLEMVLACLADRAQDEEAFWDSRVRRAVQRTTSFWADGTAVLDGIEFCRFPVALQRRAIRKVIRLVRGNLQSIDSSHIESARSIIHSELGHSRVQIPGMDILKSFKMVLFAGPEYLRQPRNYSLRMTEQCRASLPYQAGWISVNPITSGTRICANVKSEITDLSESAELDSDRVRAAAQVSGLEVRNWQPGDQMQVEPAGRSVKLKELFQQHRVPLWERRHWPVLVAGGQIVWARRFGGTVPFQVSDATTARLQVCYRTVKRLKDANESKCDVTTSV